MAGAGNAGGGAAVVVIVLAVTVALLASSLAPADAFRTYFPEDEELLRNKGRGTTVGIMTAVPGSPVSPAGAPSGVELMAFAEHADDVSPGPAPSAGVDSERAAADDVILP